ncbi:MAG: DEAD/DEAH box helicase [Acidobacteria bacterium]|nr:MAG: DEAD/DEAH box helicase [Acidobacteriota bacterium]
MKQYNLNNLVGSLRNSLLSYMCSSLPVGNHSTQEKLGEEFYKRWEATTFKGPFLEGIPIYPKTVPPKQMFSGDPGSPERAERFASLITPRFNADDFADRLLRNGKPERVVENCRADELRQLWERQLYEHQYRAFKVATEGRNLAVATGTGSGKTECFMLPLLYSLLTEPEEVRRQPAVRALLLYPMNALVEDQMRRLRTLLCWINGQSELAGGGDARLTRRVTFGRYVGTTRLSPKDPSRDRSDPAGHIAELGEMLYREDMQQTPPDILITNFSMLEYMLLRNDDKRLFSKPELFRFLVLDEVHSYRGTQGMEVACLLRRLDDLLHRKANGHEVHYQRIGLSATLPSDASSRKQLAKFVSDLFGTEFREDSLIAEPEIQPGRQILAGHWPGLGQDLIELSQTAPTLWAEFGLEGAKERREDIPEGEWETLAVTLESAETAPGEDFERNERLGRILKTSPIYATLGSMIHQRKVNDFGEVAMNLFGGKLDAHQTERALGILLQLICAGAIDGSGLLPLRAHFFVKEQREAQLCISPAHTPAAERETDGWWKRAYMVHHTRCDDCDSLVFPVMLCRRCGFVLLEAWLRNGNYFPEPDGLMPEGSFNRVLFRPSRSVPGYLLNKFTGDPPEDTQICEFEICLRCGQQTVLGPNGEAVTTSHACGKAKFVRVVQWSAPASNVRITRCPHCDQQYYKGQEVVTAPMLSPYGAATVMLEEVKRFLDAPLEHSINKVLCFSDSRQQAAKIARRLGRTNEDFVFRQLAYDTLRQAPGQQLTTRPLVEKIIDKLRDDIGLAALFCDERAEFARDTDLLRRRVSTLLFREFCTEFQTLERLGMVRVRYPIELVASGAQAVSQHWVGQKLMASEHEALFAAFLDWHFRLNRWAVTAATLQTQIEHKDLGDRYGYREKTVALWSAGLGGPLGFCMGKRDSRSRRFNFYIRVCRKFPVLQGIADLEGFNKLAEIIWKQTIAKPAFLTRQSERGGPDPDKPFVIIRGSEPEKFELKLNFESFMWELAGSENQLYRCNYCGYVAAFNVHSVCPMRDCGGELRSVTLNQITRDLFSPSGHYIHLITEREPKPIWVEEHTAQLSPTRRSEIEREFRRDEVGSLDVISGSTTFELGVDLGEINSIMLANLPPEISNYRQRAGRAGRRPGMLPFILGYVRERPHDKYFWSDLEKFIAGPLRVPRLANPSREIVLRHANAILYAYLLDMYPAKCPLQGPPCLEFTNFCLNPIQKAKAKAAAHGGPLSDSLRALLRINPGLRLTTEECADQFFKTLEFHASRNFTERADDHSIDVLSDFGILPSYSFPIYVDELVLYQKPPSEPPRCNLKLQRDRRIGLREYFPGRLIEADKWVLQSVGVRAGFERRTILVCGKCGRVHSDLHHGPCSNVDCAGQCDELRAIVPKGGFLGQVPLKPPPPDSELFEQQVSEVIFDPASDPEPIPERRGRFLLAARQSASDMANARMRIFSPRPSNPKGLQLVESDETDIADNARMPLRCLMLPGRSASSAQASPKDFYLMHEFTTDILRMRFAGESAPYLLSSPLYCRLAESGDGDDRVKAQAIFRYTLGQALATAASRRLQIDPAEMDFTLRSIPGEVALNTEFILFDTAPGGAGYASRCGDDGELQAIFYEAVQLLQKCKCADSCYSCLRSYSNQWMHARLNRTFVLDGLQEFLGQNWAKTPGPSMR